jgi:hypothetical protein
MGKLRHLDVFIGLIKFCTFSASLIFLFDRCDDFQRLYSDADLVVQKSTSPNTCVETTLDNFPFQIVDSDLLFIQNLGRRYFEVNDNGDSVINVIITNENDYLRYIGTENNKIRPAVDFSKYILLGTEITVFQCAFLEKVNVAEGCDGLILVTNIWTGTCERAISRLRQFVLVERSQSSFSFAQRYAHDLSKNLFGEILTNDSCLTGVISEIEVRQLTEVFLRNISEEQIIRYGTRTEGSMVLLLLINSQIDYEKYGGTTLGSLRPSIDFTKKSLAAYAILSAVCTDFSAPSFENGCTGVIIRTFATRTDVDGCPFTSQFLSFSKTNLALKFRLKQ